MTYEEAKVILPFLENGIFGVRMKKLALITAIIMAATSTANAAPTIYGRAGAVVNYESKDYKDDAKKDTSATTIESLMTRFGVKGSENLTANTDLIYQLEYGLKLDDEGGPKKIQFKSRDTYLGLKNKHYGTVKVGRNSAIDPDYAFKNTSLVYDNDYGGSTWNGLRLNNSVVYESPKYNGFYAMGLYAVDENNDSIGAKALADSYDISTADNHVLQVAGYYEPENNPLKAGVSYTTSGDFNSARVSAGYNVNKNVNVGALYQVSDSGTDGLPKENLTAVGASYQTATPWSIYGEVGLIKDVKFKKGDDSQQYVVGADYKFPNKVTTAHIYAGYQNYDANADTADFTSMNVGAGLIHRF